MGCSLWTTYKDQCNVTIEKGIEMDGNKCDCRIHTSKCPYCGAWIEMYSPCPEHRQEDHPATIEFETGNHECVNECEGLECYADDDGWDYYKWEREQ